MNIIKTLSHHTWGANQKSLLTIYKSFILSKIKYGSLIYNSAKPNLFKNLDPIHNKGIRLAIGAFRTSPIDSILNYAEEIPLQLQRDQDTLKYIIKRKITSNHIGHKTIFNNFITSPINTEHNKSINLPRYRTYSKDYNNQLIFITPVVNISTFQVTPPWR